MIRDSGERREFDTGAVRDIQVGKGRCDLLPLRVVDGLYPGRHVPGMLASFVETDNTIFLYKALSYFAVEQYSNTANMLLEAAVHFEEGAQKYGENNWQKGLPVSCYIDSALRHWLKLQRGDDDENHARAFVWNLMCCVWEVDHRVKDK